MSHNGRQLSRLLGAAAARLEEAFDPELVWSGDGWSCRRVGEFTLRVEGPDGQAVEYTYPGVDLDLLA